MRMTFRSLAGLLLGAVVVVGACGGTPPQDPVDPGQTVHSTPVGQEPAAMPKPVPDKAPVPDPGPEPQMGAAVHVHFEVQNYDKWKAVFDAGTEARIAAGQTWSVVGHLMEDENQVVVRIGFRDAKSMAAMIKDPKLAEAMKKAGVKGQPTIWMAKNWAMQHPKVDLTGKQTYMLITSFKVSDYAAFKTKFDGMAEQRKANGEFAHIIGRGLEDRNTVVLTVALTGDMPSADAIMGTKEAKKAMQACGANGEPEVWFSKTTETYWRGNDPVLFVNFKVANFDKWKTAFDAHLSVRGDAGIKWHSVARDKNSVLVALDGKDLAKLQAFAGSADLKKAMKDSGVKGKPEMWWTTEYEGVNHSIIAEGAVSAFVIKHEVKDFDVWKKAYDAHRGTRIKNGVVADRVHRGIDNPNVVVVTGFANDAKKLKKLFKGKAIKKAMKAAGVKGKPTIWIGTKVELHVY